MKKPKLVTNVYGHEWHIDSGWRVVYINEYGTVRITERTMKVVFNG